MSADASVCGLNLMKMEIKTNQKLNQIEDNLIDEFRIYDNENTTNSETIK